MVLRGPSDTSLLLDADDVPPVLEHNPAGRSPFLLTSDHYGRAIPGLLGDLGLPERELTRHIAWDIGISGVAEALSKAIFSCPLPIQAAYRFRNEQGSV